MIPHLGLLDSLRQTAALVLYLGMIPVFLLSIFKKPLIGVVYVVPLLPIQVIRFRMHVYPLGASFVDIILLGVILGLLRTGQFSFSKSTVAKIGIAIALYTYLSLWKAVLIDHLPPPLWFNDLRLSNWKNEVIVPFVVFLCVFGSVRTVKQMKVLILAMCFTMLILSRQTYGSARQHTFEKFDYNARAEGFDNGLGSNELGALQTQFCFFVLGLWACEEKRAYRWGYLAIAALSAYCVMVSFSRGAYVAFLMGWLFLGVVKKRWLLLALVVFAFIWQTLVPPAVVDRVYMTVDDETGTLDSSAAERVTLWEDAIEAFKQEPVFGKGFNTYQYLGRLGGWRDSHNYYIKLIFELGVIGTSLYLALFFGLYRIGYRLFRLARDPFLRALGLGLACWMVCAVFANIFGDRWNWVQITGYMWAITGCVARGHVMQREKAAETAEPVETPATWVTA